MSVKKQKSAARAAVPVTPVSGQLFVRETPGAAMAGPGRRLVMVIGLMAIPDDMPVQGEHQYVVTGTPDGRLLLHHDLGIDRADEARGQSLGQVVLNPWWRV